MQVDSLLRTSLVASVISIAVKQAMLKELTVNHNRNIDGVAEDNAV